MKNIVVFSAWLFCLSLSAQTTVTGYVFEDINQNGRKERREKGIPAVAVTNGREVVLTNIDGKYELPIGEDDIISVIKPSGYKVGKNENNLPQFFYIHKPKGSPDLKFKGVAPTGKLPKSVDFALISSEESEEFTALIFGDPQPYTQQEVDFFAAGIVAEVEAIENIPFGLSLGDLVGDDLDLFNPYIQAVKRVGIPWYNLLGNHDINFDVETDEMSDETYEAHFGPANYSFNYGKVHFLVLDDVLYPDPRDGKGYWGGFREDQFQYIENDLKFVPKDHLVVIAVHIPLSEPQEQDTFRDEDRKRLFQLLKDFPNTLSLSAHTHIQRQDFFGKDEGWPQEKLHHHYNVGTTSGDWYSGKLDENNVPVSTMRDGTPKGYAFINFNGNQYSIDYKVAGKPADYQMEVFAPKVVAKGKRTKAGIYVNFFMGTEGDELLYRINEGEWNKMQYVEEADPSYVKMVYDWDTTEELMPGRRSSNPIKSEHLWRGNIPTNLEAGEHTIQIKATDMFGKVHTATSSYRLEEPK
ncbi:MAG TPA: calcineurin-like phosphoesterase family protein [Gillisia sp.]|nr:calcineurin-like phosphoesterase family protein [Gillisia sp.]